MGNSKFTHEEIRYLVSLPAVIRVANGRIEYSERFKRHAMARYNNGDSPVRIFRDAGLDPALIGYKRIERCVARWKTTPKCLEGDDSPADEADADAPATPLDVMAGHDTSWNPPNPARRPAAPTDGADGDIRDLLIVQQIRRIAELEHRVDTLQALIDKTDDTHDDMPARGDS